MIYYVVCYWDLYQWQYKEESFTKEYPFSAYSQAKQRAEVLAADPEKYGGIAIYRRYPLYDDKGKRRTMGGQQRMVKKYFHSKVNPVTLASRYDPF